MRASEFFDEGKTVCNNAELLNIRVVQSMSLRSFGEENLWHAAMVFCDEFLDVEGDFNMISINAQLFFNDSEVDHFIDAVKRYDTALEAVARDVAVHAQLCATYGIDYIEVR